MIDGKKLYTIGDISKICGVPIKTLRYYDEISLLVPSRRDTETNYRYYTESQMLILHNIKKLQNYGFSLDEIRELIYNGSLSSLGENLDKRLNEIHKKIESLQSLYDKIKFELCMIKTQQEFSQNKDNPDTCKNDTPFGLKVETIPERKLVYTRRVEKNYENSRILISRWFELFNLVRKNGLNVIGSITETYNNSPLEQFLKKDCDVQTALPISEFTGDYPFFKTEPEFKAVTAMHSGNYENIISTHVTALKWLNKNGFEVCGPVMQEYIISPVDVKNRDEFLTKIIIPVSENK
ncbi:MAG: MerR family transcriptional regulator [Clostridia bacterium]|jgi:DNA-binding transcriptional MerR regulator|nr:MerR family transcriptional regulator [Clostridia bacterium]MCI1999677.1 MerR family transcriptional regulator [Clostridia bacterium]MCI2013944.1 MerR family transcriptional regulator [Clostridia bacterium]